MVKNQKSLLKKEFDLFRGLKNESTREIIERYCNLLSNMKRLCIEKDNEELIEKLVDALPHETWVESMKAWEDEEVTGEKEAGEIADLIRDDILAFFNTQTHHTQFAKLLKNEGGAEMMKSKKSLLKKEFDLFSCLKGENIRQMIERYSHLIIELKRFGIEKDREEIIGKLVDAVPNENDWSTYIMILKNSSEFDKMSLQTLIQKLECHELEIQKQNKMNNSNFQQDVNLVIRRSQRFMEIKGQQCVGGPNTKLGFDKSKTTSTSKNDEPEKNHVEEIIDVNQEMTTEYLTKITDQTMMVDLKEKEIQTESAESSQKKTKNSVEKRVENIEIKIELQCRKCIETCSACIEKDEIIKFKHVELTKTENALKEKCAELASKEEVHTLNQKQINELNREIDSLKSDLRKS
ncbi:uncharacterized protein LOC110892734 [Helianthus annuus]|uniref:uncharacterized protein LOC110892734 n=1 Tax=Helianthus annuus TaxID=4232 RepID=UPI000B9027F2|nr:uncharacterized protein LOC110892734 [Helianthus annuus]